MPATLFDYLERRKIIDETYPADLLEDLQDSEPALYNEAQNCDANIALFKNRLKNSVSSVALLPSFVTPGWDRPKKQKFSKNWPDMENLLKLYAIGLYFKNKPLTPQAIHDKQELSDVIQKASMGPKCKKGIPAEKRLANAKTFLSFGLRTLDICFQPDAIQKQQDLDYLDAEISEASNEYNADKLLKSKTMALRVARLTCERYQKN